MSPTSQLSIRAKQFIALREELLGPRRGDAYEAVKSPKFEYVTGVLAPVGFKHSMPGDFTRADLAGRERRDGFEDDEDDDSSDFDASTKLLHPLELPKSIGISFLLDKEKTPLDFCASFARYYNGVRKPFVFIKNGVDGSNDRGWPSPEGDVKIKLISRRVDSGNFHVSLFLVNEADVKNKQRPAKHDYVFQPQLRINLVDDKALHPVRSFSRLNDKEEQQIRFLYRDRRALAKGHMTGAVWKDIDPERPFGGNPNALLPPDISEHVFVENGHPSEWVDRFTNPHLRTDFLPSYSINQTTVDAANIGMSEEDMNADTLAENFDSPKFFESLNKLVEAYKGWIRKQDISDLSGKEKMIAEKNLEDCKIVCRRMMAGVKLLEDRRIRLAFCFSNKAMSIQAGWAGRKKMVWRPFQLAFILQCLEGIAKPTSGDRNICDLLWYPTGGGKTEAYVGILIFAIALRRLNRAAGDSTCYGTSVISRYTLRLLTIQQFRRNLSAITACELLRSRDWNPSDIAIPGEPLWGTVSFSTGLWVGGGLTPNELLDRPNLGYNPVTRKPVRYVGAISILTYNHFGRANQESSHENQEPAQILKCPCCNGSLSIPRGGVDGGEYRIFLTVRCKNVPDLSQDDLSSDDIVVTRKPQFLDLPNSDYHALKLNFKIKFAGESDRKINNWWRKCINEGKIPGKPHLECTAASRPGYFLRRESTNAGNPYHSGSPYDVEIRCPDPACDLNKEEWREFIHTSDGKQVHTTVSEPFRKQGSPKISGGIPIPAFCVDSQIYTKCPSLIIATADKFAQLPILAKTASMFGNINTVDDLGGFYRNEIRPKPDDRSRELSPMPSFLPPNIILQDELHLIDGPLGSMVGLYETAIDVLSTRYDNGTRIRPKYLASTATIRAAEDQIKSLYCREFRGFPPQGIVAGKNFFSDFDEAHPLDDRGPGRWYVGVMAPGKGPITPITRIWSSMLQGWQTACNAEGATEELDYFRTIVGYFNAMRELAGVTSAYRQDIRSRIEAIASRNDEGPRNISQLPLELHSNISDKTNISAILEKLEKEKIDAVLATSMFGTGVDIDRLSQMIVNGQPKTTSSYIQATGRVGRKRGALVVTFLRSTRSRDLDHYEFFTGYHRALHHHVEPLTVFPFSPGVVDKGLLPVAVAILRNGTRIDNVRIDSGWAHDDYHASKTSGCRRMAKHRHDSREIDAILEEIGNRNGCQPDDRIQPEADVVGRLRSLISSWEIQAKKIGKELYYHEWAYGKLPKHHVVLGDEKHVKADLSPVNKNTPNSLRDVESSMRFSE